jgi:hypothetical protein
MLGSLGLLFQLVLAANGGAADTTRSIGLPWDASPHVRSTATVVRLLRFDELAHAPLADTVRRRGHAVQYSDAYGTRLAIHKALSWAMIPLFIGSGYTGFVLRSQTTNAPDWVRKLHGPLAGATAIVFAANTLTGTLNLIESRKDPTDRTKRLLHGAMFLAAAGGFAYVIAAGDNIHEYGRANHWHRDVALASMGVSVISWAIMTF